MTPLATPSPDAEALDALVRVFSGEALADIEGVPRERLEKLYDEACDRMEREDFGAAVEPLATLVMYDPYEVQFQFGYGLCLHQLGQVQDAARHYGLAFLLDSSDAACAFRLGECHVALADRESAIEAFQTAIALCAAPDAPREVRVMAEEALDLLNA